MAPFEDSRDAPAGAPDRQSFPGAPRWVKFTGIVVLALVVLLVVLKLAGVEHGPGRHSGSPSGQTAVAQVTQDGAVPGAALGSKTPRTVADGHTAPPGVAAHDGPQP